MQVVGERSRPNTLLMALTPWGHLPVGVGPLDGVGPYLAHDARFVGGDGGIARPAPGQERTGQGARAVCTGGLGHHRTGAAAHDAQPAGCPRRC